MAARNRINGPTVDEFDPSYFQQCRFSLEPSLIKLVEMAVAAGWNRKEVATAIMFMGAEMTRGQDELNAEQN